MQLPKNIMQIGTINEFYRVYMEDYVYTYIKQLEQTEQTDKLKIYLFGKQEYKQDEMFLYIFGAADSDKGILSIQNQFFSKYEILGIMNVYRGQKEISLQNSITFCVSGFFVFYEQNPAMQAFLIYNYQQKEKEENTKFEEKKEVIPEKVRNYRNRKDAQHGKTIYAATYIMGIVICIIAITAINRYDKMHGFNENILQAGNMNTTPVAESKTEVAFYIEETIESQEESKYEATEENTTVEEASQTSFWEQIITTSEEAVTETSEEPSIESYTEYVVEKGDNLAEICRAFYGNENRLKEICLLNSIDDPDKIKQGQKILLP